MDNDDRRYEGQPSDPQSTDWRTGSDAPEPVPSEPAKSPWYQNLWLNVGVVLVAVVAVVAFVGNMSSDSPEDAFLEAFEFGFRQEAEISDSSWECIETRLRDGGHLDAIEFDDMDADELQTLGYGSGLNDLSPDVQNFLTEFLNIAVDPSSGCLTAAESIALGQTSGGNEPTTFGSHPVLDDLYLRCGEGSLADCDMLYLETVTGSEYEESALTCGGQNAALDPLVSSCLVDYDDLSQMDEIRQECVDGFFPACGLLYWLSAIGSEDERIATTCGDRREPSEVVTCSIAFGLGTR